MVSNSLLDVVSEPAARSVGPAGGSVFEPRPGRVSERCLHIALALDGASEAERLGDAIAELAARLHAATYELLALLRQFDERAGWNCGFLSCAHWLHWRTGIDLGAAREKVRVAKALASLPRVSAAMQRGTISYAKVRALTRVATPENEVVLLDFALAGTAAHVERFVRAWRRVDRAEDARHTEARHLRRELSTWVDDDGMVVIRGRLAPDVGAVVRRALEAAADRLYRESAGAPSGAVMAEDLTPGQRRADALGLLAEAALAADLDRGTAGDRYQVVLHVEPSQSTSDGPLMPECGAHTREDAPDLANGLEPRRVDGTLAIVDGLEPRLVDGTLELADGAIHTSAETSRRLACDASVVVMRHDGDGKVLDVGRRTRTIPSAIRRALQARDTACRFPGCTARRCDAHHVTHWIDGGAPRFENLVLLCRRHHRAVHEGGFTLAPHPDGSWIVHRPDGRPLEVAPVLPPWDRASDLQTRDGSLATAVHSLAPVTASLAAAGIVISARSVALWDGTPFDVVWAMDVLRGKSGAPESAGRAEGAGWAVAGR